MEENEIVLKDHEFNLSDFALFLSVVKNPKAYLCMLSVFMEEPDIELSEVKAEQVILNKVGKRAIRLDAWVKYTFSEQCEEISGLKLEDGTKKIFLNMSSKNGTPELVSMLQYIKNTTIDNPEILVKDPRILELDEIVTEVKSSEEWEAVEMNILEIGIEHGIKKGVQQKLVELVEKKLKKGLSAAEIAELLEEDLETIQKIVVDLQKK